MTHDEPITVVDDPDRPGSARLVLLGRVTISSAGRLHAAARDLCARGCDVTVCCEAAEYLDGPAIQVLLGLGRELVRAGKRCDVRVGAGGPLLDVFRLAGLGDLVPA